MIVFKKTILFERREMHDFDEKLFFEILQGKFENIPTDRSKVVRIFLSSTFSGKLYFLLIFLL